MVRLASKNYDGFRASADAEDVAAKTDEGQTNERGCKTRNERRPEDGFAVNVLIFGFTLRKTWTIAT